MPELSIPGGHLELGGKLRQSWEDFRVEEIPLYTPSGSGEHWLICIEKRGVSTGFVVQRLQKLWRLKPQDVGIAGQKDRGAIARQWVSLPGRVPESELSQIESEEVSVIEVCRHDQKIRRGHLLGNRFDICVRDAAPGQLAAARAMGEQLVAEGMPNPFGAQRFGAQGRNPKVGGHLVRGDAAGLFLEVSTPTDGENPRLCEAREMLASRDWGRARRAFPPTHALERHLAAASAKGLDEEAASRSLPRTARDFVVSAWQSEAFNQVLARRLSRGRGLLAGDLMTFLPRGACFSLDDPSDPKEVTRVQALEIAPTGPLPGWKMSAPTGEAGAFESESLAQSGHDRPQWSDALLPRGSLRGERRALWVPLSGFSVEEEQVGVYRFRFELPRGSFATSALECFGVPARASAP